MRQQPTTRTTTIRPRTTTNESRRLVGEFLWDSPSTAGPIDLPPPPANDGQRRPTQVNEGPQQPTQANAGPRKPTAANDGQQRPLLATTFMINPRHLPAARRVQCLVV